jgi:uncharacterized protein (DUF1800 family)
MENATWKHIHFYWRAGFGPTPEMLGQASRFKPSTFFEAYAAASKKAPAPLLVASNLADGLMNGLGELGRMQSLSEEDRRKQRQQMQAESRKQIRSLNLMWLNEMVHSPAQLREKMSLFWHNHFACRNLNSYYQQQLINVIREGALGSFSSLLKEVSKTPAMLQFLNNQQNRKQQPNENFAREVMELFTLGRGQYSEADIKEAARAFTGWGFDAQGQFVFRRNQHDEGSKTVLGKTGRFDGEDVLNILLEKPETAIFITRKLYKFLVSEQAPAGRIEWLARRFYEGGYEILPLLKDIFTADWFYDDTIAGSLVKSPVELIAGICRILPMELEREEILLLAQRVLGQILFYPPSVAGWPGGTNWIDSSSLLFRMQLPRFIAGNSIPIINLKSDDDVEMGMRINQGRNQSRFSAGATIDWKKVFSAFAGQKQEFQAKSWQQALLTAKAKSAPELVQKFIGKHAEPEKHQAEIILLLMSLPEYQLC